MPMISGLTRAAGNGGGSGGGSGGDRQQQGWAAHARYIIILPQGMLAVHRRDARLHLDSGSKAHLQERPSQGGR